MLKSAQGEDALGKRSEAAGGSTLMGAMAKIAFHRTLETFIRPIARVGTDVPWRIEAVTPEWLTAVLCKNHQGAGVVECDFGSGSKGTSVRRQIRLRYNDAGRRARLPDTVFAKSTPTVLTRLANGFSGTTVTEANFYQTLRPLVNLEAPIGYHSAYSLESYRSIHLLEDLVATKNAVFCSPNSYINRDQATEIIDILAALHSRFYGDAQLKSKYPWLKTYPQWFRDGDKWANLRGHHDKAMIEAAEVIPADILSRRGEVWPTLTKSLESHEQLPPTVLHSDVHLGNWYITGAGRMGLCDWQCVNIGLWARDFAYAVSATLTIEDRRAWERDLLERYIEQMAAATNVRLNFDDAWNCYRQQLPAALLMWTPTLCHPPLLPDMQTKEICFEMIKRMTTAMSDLDSLDSFNKPIRRSPEPGRLAAS